jgi:hypothetical protein
MGMGRALSGQFQRLEITWIHDAADGHGELMQNNRHKIIPILIGLTSGRG